MFTDAGATRKGVLEFCLKKASQMGREKKSQAVKCHFATGESKE